MSNLQQTPITLADIAGYQEEKKEAVKMIDILKNFETYKAKGASVPKGLILCGQPGVGKTMFAKAIATESGTPLYEFEAGESENEEETIRTLKDLFTKARETVPSIIFIDELDELVSSTEDEGFYGFQSDYSRKTLKTLLTEIDGVSSSDGILVIATTNSKKTIPPALIRSGRLEKQITFQNPSVRDRTAIAKLYLDRASIKGVDPEDVAQKTDRFTGADIKSLINGALIESIRKKEEVTMRTITELIPTIRFGEIKKTNPNGPSDAVCYHEIGHFLAQYGLTGRIGSISVEQFGQIRGHVIMDDPWVRRVEVNDDNRSADEILDSIVVSLGGIAGEEVFLGKRYCGSALDVEQSIRSLFLVLANGCLGFEYLPSFRVETCMLDPQTQIAHTKNFAKELCSQKAIDILYEKLEVAKNLVQQWQDLGRVIFLNLKQKRSLSSEELTIIVNDYRKEHDHEIHS